MFIFEMTRQKESKKIKVDALRNVLHTLPRERSGVKARHGKRLIRLLDHDTTVLR